MPPFAGASCSAPDASGTSTAADRHGRTPQLRGHRRARAGPTTSRRQPPCARRVLAPTGFPVSAADPASATSSRRHASASVLARPRAGATTPLAVACLAINRESATLSSPPRRSSRTSGTWTATSTESALAAGSRAGRARCAHRQPVPGTSGEPQVDSSGTDVGARVKLRYRIAAEPPRRRGNEPRGFPGAMQWGPA